MDHVERRDREGLELAAGPTPGTPLWMGPASGLDVTPSLSGIA